MSVKYSVVIPNYNGEKFLKDLLTSIVKNNYLPSEIVLVDNNSTDQSVKLSKALVPSIKVVNLKKNVGFGAAANNGIAQAKYPYVALLNNDTVLNHNWFEQINKAIGLHPDYFCYCPTVIDIHSNIENTGFIFDISGKATLRKLAKNLTKVWGAPATAVVYNKALFSSLGGFDTRYFAYIEDVDLHYRANTKLLETIYVKNAICTHFGGGTAGKNSYFRAKNTFTGWLYFINKNYSLQKILKYFPQIFLERCRNFSYLVRCLVQ